MASKRQPNTRPIVRLPGLHATQQHVRATAGRYNVLRCGRRWGKTTLDVDLIAEVILGDGPASVNRMAPPGTPPAPSNVYGPLVPTEHPSQEIDASKTVFAPGEKPGGKVGYFVPTTKLLIEVWDDLYGRLQGIIEHSNEQERRMEFITGGLMEMWTLEARDVARSRAYHRVIVDEAGLVPDLVTRWQQEIRPTLADFLGDAWFNGTPKGRNGFWRLAQYAEDGLPGWVTWQYQTGDNPFMQPDEIAEMARTMTERTYQQEICAEFLSDGGGVFRLVEEACCLSAGSPEIGHEYVIGVDWGRQSDFTVFSVLDCTSKRQVAMDRFTKMDYANQRRRLWALCDRWKPWSVLAERNAMGGPIIEQLQDEGLAVTPFDTTSRSKQGLIDGLALALEQQAVKLLDDEQQKQELLAYESERLESGLIRFSAPEGMHDDCVMALALAWSYAGQSYWTPQPREDEAKTVVDAYPALKTLFPDAYKRLKAGAGVS